MPSLRLLVLAIVCGPALAWAQSTYPAFEQNKVKLGPGSLGFARAKPGQKPGQPRVLIVRFPQGRIDDGKQGDKVRVQARLLLADAEGEVLNVVAPAELKLVGFCVNDGGDWFAPEVEITLDESVRPLKKLTREGVVAVARLLPMKAPLPKLNTLEAPARAIAKFDVDGDGQIDSALTTDKQSEFLPDTCGDSEREPQLYLVTKELKLGLRCCGP